MPRCYGILQNETSTVCNEQGTCDSLDTCRCYSGWGSPYCNMPTCNGILQNSSSACSGHGSCDAPDTCRCTTTGWVGQFCAMPTCNGFLQNDTANFCKLGHQTSTDDSTTTTTRITASTTTTYLVTTTTTITYYPTMTLQKAALPFSLEVSERPLKRHNSSSNPFFSTDLLQLN